jgi:hypothetical protein
MFSLTLAVAVCLPFAWAQRTDLSQCANGVCSAAGLAGHPGRPTGVAAGDALSFKNNWFLTGDYVVGGVGLRGTGVSNVATGTINIAGVPANADIIAAYLYWETLGNGQNGTFLPHHHGVSGRRLTVLPS